MPVREFGLAHFLSERDLTDLFQPIVEIAGDEARLHALECLTRGLAGTELEGADQLFRRDAELPSFLFRTAEQHGLSLGRLILEIVEYAPSLKEHQFMNAIAEAREKGLGIKIDDIGAGASNYRRILDCRADYFKIDRYFVHGANHDEYRRAVFLSVAELGRKVGARVIAEGVEEMQDLDTLAEVGIDLAQGFLFSRPRVQHPASRRRFLGRRDCGCTERGGGKR